MDCIFCQLEPERIELENNLALAILDKYPITPGHRLIIPKRHCGSYFKLENKEIEACNELLRTVRNQMMAEDPDIGDFNIGINDGPLAGQTVPHCHIHLVPRRKGDVGDPRGGIRHIIPGKGKY